MIKGEESGFGMVYATLFHFCEMSVCRFPSKILKRNTLAPCMFVTNDFFFPFVVFGSHGQFLFGINSIFKNITIAI